MSVPIFLSIDGIIHNPARWERVELEQKANTGKLQQFFVVARIGMRSIVLRKFTTKETAIKFLETLSGILYAVKL